MSQQKTNNSTPISELGEFKLIDRIKDKVTIYNNETIKGIGDDAAVIDSGENFHLISTDLLVEGVHFDLAYTPLKHLGYKAVIANISDICAMNGKAKQITIGLALSNRFPVESVDELYEGINLAAKKYKIDVVGGDTTSSTSGLMISVSVLGIVKKKKIVYRSGANKNDLVVVTGDLGAAYLGLQLLKREKQIFLENPKIQPDLSGHDYILERQLKPECGVHYLNIMQELKVIPTSMIDISDGLASEALHLAQSSNVSIMLYEDKIPIDHTVMNLANEFNLNPVLCALNGGEDYELLFTISQKEYDKFKKDVDFTIVGYVADKTEESSFIAKDNTKHPLTAQGWNSLLD